MRIVSKQKNRLLQFLNFSRKLNIDAINRPSLHTPRNRELLKSSGADHHHKFLLKNSSPEKDKDVPLLSILSAQNSSSADRSYFTLPTLPFLEEDLEIAPSCNGLLHFYNAAGLEGAVWNPSTAEFKFLDPSSVKRPHDTDSSTAALSALGFDSRARDYKLLRFVDNCVEDIFITQIELYSFKTDSWKEIFTDDDRRRPYYWKDGIRLYYLKPSVYAGGCFYWSDVDRVWSFDFADERFSWLYWPHIGNCSRACEFDLVEFDGRLGCIAFPKVGTRKKFEVWVMKGGGLWSKERVVNVCGDRRLLGFWGKGNGELMFLQVENGKKNENLGRLLVYDCSTNKLRDVGVLVAAESTNFIPFVESKLPLAQQLETNNTFIQGDPKRYVSMSGTMRFC